MTIKRVRKRSDRAIELNKETKLSQDNSSAKAVFTLEEPNIGIDSTPQTSNTLKPNEIDEIKSELSQDITLKFNQG